MKKFIPSLELILGPVKSAKSEEAIRRAKRYERFCKVLFVSPEMDSRTRDGIATSRSGLKFDTIRVNLLTELEKNEDFLNAQVIVLDEAQFFPDIVYHVTKWCDSKGYIISSLDGDFKQKQFGEVWNLIPYADKVEKLSAICDYCQDGTPGICSFSCENIEGQVKVVDSESNIFIPVCRKHRRGVIF